MNIREANLIVFLGNTIFKISNVSKYFDWVNFYLPIVPLLGSIIL